MNVATSEDDVAPGAVPVRVVLPGHLRTLAAVDGELTVGAVAPVTLGSVLDAVEERWPMLRGAIRDHGAGPRRPYVRLFACEEDLSFLDWDAPVPEPVAAGREPLLVVGSISGG